MDGLAGYFLDSAVRHFGEALDQELERVITPTGKNAKPYSESQRNLRLKQTLERWLQLPKQEQQYRNPYTDKRGVRRA